MNIPIEEVQNVLIQKKIDHNKIQEIIKELSEIVEELKGKSKNKQKWEYVIVLNDKNDVLKGKEIAGWIVQQEENADAGLILSKLADAAKEQNEHAKRKKNQLSTLSDLFSHLKSKFLKPKKIRIKTKNLTRVIIAK